MSPPNISKIDNNQPTEISQLAKSIKEADEAIKLHKRLLKRHGEEISKKSSVERLITLGQIEKKLRDLERSPVYQNASKNLKQKPRQLRSLVKKWYSSYVRVVQGKSNIEASKKIKEQGTIIKALDHELLTPRYTYYIRLGDTRLKPEDKVLITKNLSRKRLLRRCVKHWIRLKEAVLDAYTGVEEDEEMPESKRVLAFHQLCETRFGKKIWGKALGNIWNRALALRWGFTRKEFSKLMNMPDSQIGKYLHKIWYEFMLCPPGTKEKIWRYRRVNGFGAFIGLFGSQGKSLDSELSRLSKDIQNSLIRLEKAGKTFETSDDKKVTKEFKSLFQRLYFAYLTTPPSTRSLNLPLYMAIKDLSLKAREFGFYQKDISSWVAEVNGRFEKKLKGLKKPISKIEDLCRGHYRLSPKELPYPSDPVDPYNSRSGLKTINIISNVLHFGERDLFTGGTILARALSLAGSATFSICETKEEPPGHCLQRLMPAWKVDNILNHEGLHALQYKKYFDTKPQMLRTVPSERQAYIVSFATLLAHRKRLLESGYLQNKKTFKELNKTLFLTALLIKSANYILKYPLDDFSFREDLPKNPKFLDIGFPPTDAFPLLFAKNSHKLVGRVGLNPMEESLAENTLREIFLGDVRIEARAKGITDRMGYIKLSSIKIESPVLSRAIYEKNNRKVINIPLTSHPVLKVIQYYLKIKESGILDPQTFKKLADLAGFDSKSTVFTERVFRNLGSSLPPSTAKRLANQIAVLLTKHNLTKSEILKTLILADHLIINYISQENLEFETRNPKIIKSLGRVTGLPNNNRAKNVLEAGIEIAKLFYDESGRPCHPLFKSLIEKAVREKAHLQGYKAGLSFGRKELTQLMKDWYVEKYHEDWVKKIKEAKKSSPSTHPETPNF